ncbi:MAG: hypothetical protein ACSHWU_10380 [Marinicella sp.]
MSIHKPRKPYKILWIILIVLFLSHCSQRKKVDVDASVRDPAAKNNSLIQVTPMVPEAVKTLLQEADQQISEGSTTAALMTLNRALSISPSSALVQQHLAEAYLSDADYKQAMYWSTLVVNQGPDQGGLCERSRRTQALAAEMLSEVDIQAQALNSIAHCSTEHPARY